jgi:hypothetical protein
MWIQEITYEYVRETVQSIQTGLKNVYDIYPHVEETHLQRRSAVLGCVVGSNLMILRYSQDFLLQEPSV